VSAGLPTRWPPGARTAHAPGYLLARHVPLPFLPRGLTLARQVAGWLPPGSPTGAAPVGVDPGAVRSWLAAARAHAQILGPPPDLPAFLGLLADGVIRSETAARTLLVTAGAGDASDPRILIDLADWTGTRLPIEVIPVGRRHGRPVQVYAACAAGLARARALAAAWLRQRGVLAPDRLTRYLLEDGIRLELDDTGTDLRDILAITGTAQWVWSRSSRSNSLATTLHRLAGLDRDLPVSRIPEALYRSAVPRRDQIAGEWPPPLDAIRVWAGADPRWSVTAHDQLRYLGPVPPMRSVDQVMAAVLSEHGPVLAWHQLRDLLVGTGMSPALADVSITRSPLLYRQESGGYRLLA